VLTHFNWCYFTENFEETTQAVFGALGINPRLLSSNVGENERISVTLVENNIEFDVQLYQYAREMFQGLDIQEAFSRPKRAIQDFAKRPADLQTLRSFVYNSCYGEYRNWGRLEEIIQTKIKMIHEISAEVGYYLAKANMDIEHESSKVK